jgi:hypothetical protein
MAHGVKHLFYKALSSNSSTVEGSEGGKREGSKERRERRKRRKAGRERRWKGTHTHTHTHVCGMCVCLSVLGKNLCYMHAHYYQICRGSLNISTFQIKMYPLELG